MKVNKRNRGTIKYRQTPDGRSVWVFKKNMRTYDRLIFSYMIRALEQTYLGQVDAFMNEEGHLVIRHTPGQRKKPQLPIKSLHGFL